jgi:hypothetical protein
MTNQFDRPNRCRRFDSLVVFQRMWELMILTSLWVFFGSMSNAQSVHPVVDSERQMLDCLKAGKDALGDHAEVLKCGELNSPGVLEVVAALRKHVHGKGSGDIFVSRLVILRREGPIWKDALDLARQIRNSHGYVGVDFIDDLSSFWGYAVQFHDHRADGEKSFVISLAYMATEKDKDELPVDISWDQTVGRYREFSASSEPVGFRTEIENPPHRK